MKNLTILLLSLTTLLMLSACDKEEEENEKKGKLLKTHEVVVTADLEKVYKFNGLINYTYGFYFDEFRSVKCSSLSYVWELYIDGELIPLYDEKTYTGGFQCTGTNPNYLDWFMVHSTEFEQLGGAGSIVGKTMKIMIYEYKE